MNKIEAIKKLNDFLVAGEKKADIERKLKFPTNSLSAVINLKKEIPDKWVLKIEAWCKLHEKTRINMASLVPHTLTEDEVKKLMGDGDGKLLWESSEPAWVKLIEEYCDAKGIKPEDLISFHNQKVGRGAVKYVENKKVQVQELKPARSKSYNPNDNPTYKIKMGIK